jgi:hypothetical protein
MRNIKFILLLLLTNIAGWYAAEGFCFFALIFTPMTHVSFIIARVIMHIVFVLLCFWATILWFDNGTKQK